MKKAFLLASILFVSVISTACINNFAVQELNNKAKEFMDKGDYVSAIERLKSSVDLDGSVFETQYNLAQKYKDCDVYACNYEFRNAAGKVTPTILRKLPFSGKDGILDNYFVVASCSHPPLWTSAVMVRKSAIQAVGGFPVGIKSGEDLLTWAKLVINGKVAFSKQVGAVYDLGAGYDFANLPPRRQDAGDPVGQQLQQLYKSNKHIKGLRSYLSHWHKMRASVAIRFGERIETIKESFISLQYNPFNYKILPFIILSILPSKIRTNIIRRHG